MANKSSYISDKNSSLLSWAFKHLGEAGEKHIKSQNFANYQRTKHLTFFSTENSFQDEEAETLVRQH